MKKYIFEFCRRGFGAMGVGPLVLAIVYFVLHRQGAAQVLTVEEVCLGILSLSVLAFVAGGMNVVYQMERLPLMVAILVHGTVLYAGYLGTYLINGWLKNGMIPILAFTGIFVVGYLIIWAIICFCTKKKTDSLNEKLKRKQTTCN